MKVIIDVPEEVFEALKSIAEDATSLDPYSLADIIVNKSEQIDLWKIRQEATENALKKAEVLYERPHGKWIYHRAQGEFLPYMECDNCHEEFLLNMLRPAEFRKVNRFCSYCGADMRGNK